MWYVNTYIVEIIMHYFTAKYFDKDMKSKIEKTLSKSKPYYVNTKYLC